MNNQSSQSANHVFFKTRHVFLDIETTGLKPETAGITEIGAIAVENDRIVDTFHTMINPGYPIPLGIQRLCGIKEGDVKNAPDIRSVKNDLKIFLGDSPVIAHNASFEESFFRFYDLPLPCRWLDSLTLSALLRPDRSSHSLDSLLKLYTIRGSEVHRGLEDATDTFKVVLSICQSSQLPVDHIELLLKILPSPWNQWNFILETLLKTTNPGAEDYDAKLFPNRKPSGETQWNPIHKSDLDKFFKPTGKLSAREGFRYRPSQDKMANLVADAMNDGTIQLIESGTGTGKSLAYLIPAALASLKNSCHVVISTETKTLQHQLSERELPQVRDLIAEDFRWAVLKGRDNYICHRALLNRIQNPQITDTASDKFLLAVLGGSVVYPGSSGDLDHLSYWVKKQASNATSIIASIRNSGHQPCDHCGLKKTCPYQRALNNAWSANLLIVNHALTLRWPAAYPPLSHLILDEAHNLEDTATSVFGSAISDKDLHRFHYRIFNPKHGLLAAFKNSKTAIINIKKNGADNLLSQIGSESHEFLKNLDQIKLVFEKNIFGSRHRTSVTPGIVIPETQINKALHQSDLPTSFENDILEVCGKLVRTFDHFVETLKTLKSKAGKLSTHLQSDFDKLKSDLVEARDFFQRLTQKERTNLLYSFDFNGNLKTSSYEFREEPIQVAPLIYGHLWKNIHSVVLTSATLSVNNKPDFFINRLGLRFPDVYTRLKSTTIRSPFDYNNQMLAIHPSGLPKLNIARPSDILKRHHQIISDTARHFGGRTLSLLTNSRRASQLGKMLEPTLNRHDLEVLVQGHGSRENLLNRFRNDTGSVLLGVRTFWEGVDVPGPALMAVTIEKVPFQPPSNPLNKARANQVSARSNGSGFVFYTLPLALIQLRQGIGRLIRKETDEGVVIFLNHRLHPGYAQQVYGVFPVNCVTGYSWSQSANLIDAHFPSKEV